jgi:hypothetical protein
VEGAFALLITLAMLPIFGWAIVWIIKSLIMGELDLIAAVIAIVAVIALAILTIVSGSLIVAGGIMMVSALTLAFFPFAAHRMGQFELREINAGLIDKFHAAIAARQDNIAAYFALSEALYNHGFQGHAIGLATKTLEGLSQELDPMKFQSIRQLFYREEALLKRWMRESTDPRLHQPVRCPLCGFMNPPGNLACGQCEKPFLLEVVRRTDLRVRFLGRLVIAWAALGLGLGGAVFCGFTMKDTWAPLAAFGCIAVSGGVVALVLRAPRGDNTRPANPQWFG